MAVESKVIFMTENNAEKLMGVLINKMEIMDSNLNIIKAENAALKKLINNPQSLLRKMGLVTTSTPLTDDLEIDPFRADLEFGGTEILKGSTGNMSSFSNEDVHKMSWDEIHDMANSTKGVFQ